MENGDAMRKVYLLAAVAGLAIPYFSFGRFLLAYGLDLARLVDDLFANDISTFFAVDLIITALVVLVWSYREAPLVVLRGGYAAGRTLVFLSALSVLPRGPASVSGVSPGLNTLGSPA
jgi:hypothetical protein